MAVKALLKHCTEVAPLLPFVATNQPLEMQLKLLLRLSVLMAPNPQVRHACMHPRVNRMVPGCSSADDHCMLLCVCWVLGCCSRAFCINRADAGSYMHGIRLLMQNYTVEARSWLMPAVAFDALRTPATVNQFYSLSHFASSFCAQARQLFVTSGALLRLQEILKLPEITKTEMGIRVGAAGGQINTLFPVPVVEYYSSEVGKA